MKMLSSAQQAINSQDLSQKAKFHHAYLAEMFSSIQGEGPLVGQRQIFLRFAGCDLRCQWCDTPESLTIRKNSSADFELTPGMRDFKVYANPMTVDCVAEAIMRLETKLPHQSLSLTGGEPLLQHVFIKQLINKLKNDFDFQPEIYLETAGHKPEELAALIDSIDFISFDLKLPSSTMERALWQEHKEFIQIASQKKGYAKITLTAETTDSDLLETFALLKDFSHLFDLVMQPVSFVPHASSFDSPSPEQMIEWQNLAIKNLGRGKVRVIPQTHKFLGQL